MVVTRIAPSPTGDPHVGTAYMSLFDYVYAKKHQGRFILRVEDTDRKRYSPEAERRVLEALEWLDIAPDEGPHVGGDRGPYRQSERLDLYRRYAELLVKEGKAYRAFETPEELESIRAELKRRGLGHGYDGRARHMPAQEAKKRAAAGEPHVIRLITPETGETVVADLLRGSVTIPNQEVPDAILLKSDGMPTYHLAVVVDDHLMGVTHVVRGEEWIPTAPLHVLLYQAFGWQEPVWVHMPLLKNAEGKKLSKRKDDTNLDSYRRQGILPEALLNYLATMGWSMPDGREFFSISDMIEHFEFERVSLGGSIFDMRRLRHYNAKYIRELLSLEEVARRVEPLLREQGYDWEDDDYLLDVVDVLRPRAETLLDFMQHAYFFDDGYGFSDEAKRRLAGGQKYLEDLERELSMLEFYDYDSVDDTIRNYVKSQAVKMGEVMMPLRAALTGTMNAPSVTDLCVILGKRRVLSRIGRALTLLQSGLPDDKPQKPEAARAGAAD